MKGYGRLRAACYTTNLTMSIVATVSPLLFITFHNLYGVSYGLLGSLVLVNFVTQLSVDLLFSFFSHRFNIPLTVKLTPWIGAAGLILYGLAPWLMPGHVYLGLVLGTAVYSASSGLAEVLMSPVIAAIPAENPEREMSRLHSVYAWGVVGVVLVSTLVLENISAAGWMILPFLFAAVPIISGILFIPVTIPNMEMPGKVSSVLSLFKSKRLWLCIFTIFCGGAAEVTMSQWSSGYLETALEIPKAWGDIFGAAMFALLLAAGRTLYAQFGKRVDWVIFFGFCGAVICYALTAVTDSMVVGLLACAVTGFCTSMLWPGSLVMAAAEFPASGVFIYAVMASGGDLGVSVAPQLLGIIADTVAAGSRFSALAAEWGMTPDQLGLKCGMLFAALFPLAGVFLAWRFIRIRKAEGKSE